MAHMIDMSNGRANMARRSGTATPWHGLGFIVDPNASIEEWQRTAGLDWNINSSVVNYIDEHNGIHDMPERRVLHRSDNCKPLSVVSDKYRVVQPKEILEFYRDLIGVGDFEMETAGSLDEGRRIWALARTGDSVRLKGQDEVNGYLLLATSCDGSLATTARFTSIRVVCQNTLSIATGSKGGIRVPHSRTFNHAEVKQELGLVHQHWAGFADSLEALSDRKLNQDEAIDLMLQTFGDTSKKADEQDKNVLKQMREAWTAMLRSPGSDLRSAVGTAWGFVNGVTYYVDHLRSTRSADARLSRAWFGEGEVKKQRAMEAALKLVA